MGQMLAGGFIMGFIRGFILASARVLSWNVFG
jgi:uncharacterized membrane protein required for colicin V production